MVRKKSNSNSEDHNGIRLSSHEKICSERMAQLVKSIDEMKKEIKELRSDMSKGKGAINLLIIIGGVIGALVGFFNMDG
jgi:uncharacterized coiled-coil DUF342 family protein|tara:strand:- start:578 stop:814 length:237 start_codon:yes stop_codon:yes gene_type:complete